MLKAGSVKICRTLTNRHWDAIVSLETNLYEVGYISFILFIFGSVVNLVNFLQSDLILFLQPGKSVPERSISLGLQMNFYCKRFRI